MTADLHGIRKNALETAKSADHDVRVPLVTKGVSFGYLTAQADGTLGMTEIEGVDKDLVVRPWSQKGVVTSLRTFTVTALNQHHGMQPIERFGMRETGSRDFGRSG